MIFFREMNEKKRGKSRFCFFLRNQIRTRARWFFLGIQGMTIKEGQVLMDSFEPKMRKD